MKTLGEFLQRLENDSLFEKQAQTFNNGDELMAFVESEGYDFTLEALTSAFKQKAQLPPETEDTAPAPSDISASAPPGGEVTAIPISPTAAYRGETKTDSLNQGSPDLPRGPSKPEMQELPGAIPPKDLEEKSTGGLFRGGGGRHRGFSPERLKSVLGEDS
jgi:Nif11 domain